MAKTRFDWDPDKDAENQRKHGVSFSRAQYAFADPQRVIAKDEAHSQTEERFYCFGEVDGGVLTVRFTYRASVIRIIGAGYWRKGKAIYEREKKFQRRLIAGVTPMNPLAKFRWFPTSSPRRLNWHFVKRV
jgi:uncharacterized DUF497 family protein